MVFKEKPEESGPVKVAARMGHKTPDTSLNCHRNPGSSFSGAGGFGSVPIYPLQEPGVQMLKPPIQTINEGLTETEVFSISRRPQRGR